MCGAEDGVGHLVAVEVCERESSARACELVVRRDGVLQAAGFAHDGQGAVAHGDHLRQAAGLEQGRHEEQIGARVHALGQRGVELDARGHGSGVLALEVAQRVLIVGIAGAEHGHLDTAGKDPVERVRDQVHALLAGESRDHDHEGAVIADLQTEFLLQTGLANGLAGTVAGGELRGDALVGGGVEAHGIDAVDDALQNRCAAAQNPIEALTELARLDLLGVRGGDGRDGVGVVEGALHVVDGVGTAGELEGGCGNMRQAQNVVQHLGAVLTLKRDVVDGEHRLDALVERRGLVELAQEHGGHGGVPVVAVQDVACEPVQNPGQVLEGLDDGLGEEGEALSVVEEPVRIATAEVTLVVDEQVVDAEVVEALDAAVLIAPAEWDIEVAQVLHAVLVLLGDGVVLRNEHDDLGARGFEGLGQGARHVAEAAGLHEGRGFGAGKCDMEFLLGGFGHMNANLLMRALLRGVEFSDSCGYAA